MERAIPRRAEEETGDAERPGSPASLTGGVAEALDPGDEVLQKLDQIVPHLLIGQVAFGIETLVRASDEHLGLEHGRSVRENERLPELALAAGGAGRPRRSAHQGRGLALED